MNERVVGTGLDVVDWATVAVSVVDSGWVRLERAVSSDACAAIADAAPTTWRQLPEVEQSVRQGGLTCGVPFDEAPALVRAFGLAVCEALSDGAPTGTQRVPMFNDVTWGKSDQGVQYITAHRDPPGAGGVIAIVTLWGHARFRVWQGSQRIEWVTEDGDLVILRGDGWPTDESRCPMHEVESPESGDRMIMTLRYNKAGPGGDYFA
jgi:hypothetical protein